jgi:hypothetical protein
MSRVDRTNGPKRTERFRPDQQQGALARARVVRDEMAVLARIFSQNVTDCPDGEAVSGGGGRG